MFHFVRNMFIRKLKPAKVIDNLSAKLRNMGSNPEKNDNKIDTSLSTISLASSFPLTIHNCPKSLKFLVQFYRFFGYSFTGLIFKDGPTVKNQKRFNSLFFSSFMIGISAGGTLIDFLVLLFAGYYMATTSIVLNNSATNKTGENQLYYSHVNLNETNALYYELSYGFDEYLSIFAHMKPILRSILQALMFIYLFDNLLIYPVNLVHGGRLVQLMAKIPNIRSIDRSRAFAFKLIGGMSLLNVSFCVLNFAIINRQFFVYNFSRIFGLGSTMSDVEMFNVKRSTLVLALYPLYFLVESISTFFFIYMMHAFKKNITLLKNAVFEDVGKGQLGEEELLQLKLRLLELAKLFKELLAYFSLPLTLSSVGNVYLLITSVCYLMVPTTEKVHRFYTALILNFGSYGLVRLFTLCINSTLVTREYALLKAAISERKLLIGNGKWTSDEWIIFTEIRQLKKKFKVNIWQTYSLNHSAILTLLGFALNQIVVLLQTENFADSVQQQQHFRTPIN